MVDNCYGEFVEEKEPTDVGADILVGSLMKNLGAGIATSGAYIVGKKDLIELCAERLTAPGVGKEIGPSLNQNILFIKGLFFAPSVVVSAVKTAVFASRILEKLGYKVDPLYNEKRADIVQTIELGDADKLVKFCQGIQMGSPIDSNVIPEPSAMGGSSDLEQAFSFVERKMAAENEWLSSIHQGGLQADVGREKIQYLRESRQHHLPPLLRPHSC